MAQTRNNALYILNFKFQTQYQDQFIGSARFGNQLFSDQLQDDLLRHNVAEQYKY